jgi:hypothetical protein
MRWRRNGRSTPKSKLALHMALAAGIRARNLPCHVLPDGMAVRIDDFTTYEPDGLVYCGPELPPSALEVPNPVIVVEVNLSVVGKDRHIRQAARLFPRAQRHALPDCRSRTTVDHPPRASKQRSPPHGNRTPRPNRSRPAGVGTGATARGSSRRGMRESSPH